MPRLPDFPADCTITFDGRAVPARRGESIASALLADGRPLLARSAKYHRPRGPFCLAGSCGSCLVRVDGLPDQRACRTACADGLTVETQNALPDAAHDLLGVIDRAFPHGLDHHHLATWNPLANRAAVAFSRQLAGLGKLPGPERAAGPLPPAPREEAFDALVVGAGPAGLAAAEALAGAGQRVLLADAEPAPGGRLRCRLELPGDPPLAWASAVAARVAAAGGEVASATTVLGLWRDGGAPLAALAPASGALRLVRPAAILICAGGHPQPPGLEDDDRPGVVAGRGLARALAEHGVVPGRRAVVLGGGPEPEALAARLAAAGVEVERVEAAEGRVLGRARVRGLALADGRRVRCDVIAVATPPAPATELARSLGAPVALDPALGAFALQVDARGHTGVPGLLAAGEVTGAMDAARAAEAGRRAGEAARG
ncbi:FAD-dependent pyridine nucleotide-disulphide oxidoreductase [Anaeromyxobacter sp. K]|uniref:2Fe-2S iron-sulfur cluster-binding protein n=1 Tax=Anaeromyxobacter sp. (strain K) TaxID=447217 RepID=UPI00015F8D84|nr:2Fe-2S iron-sulfur cluster-binding protein [Anaeromyxobacter sp. K]ACG72611.1 FAD-dependent pyridine nucleotide-disulphide oxidoreductase [Anaeromyxobacter sp. K]